MFACRFRVSLERGWGEEGWSRTFSSLTLETKVLNITFRSADCKRGRKIGAARKLSKSVEKLFDTFWRFLALFALRENCRKVSKNFLTLFDDFWRFLTWPLSAGPFCNPLICKKLKCSKKRHCITILNSHATPRDKLWLWPTQSWFQAKNSTNHVHYKLENFRATFHLEVTVLSNCNFGPKRTWQPETWQDSAPFSPPGIRQFSPYFGAIFLAKLHIAPEEKGKKSLEKIKKKIRFLSLVVVERILIHKTFKNSPKIRHKLCKTSNFLYKNLGCTCAPDPLSPLHKWQQIFWDFPVSQWYRSTTPGP